TSTGTTSWSGPAWVRTGCWRSCTTRSRWTCRSPPRRSTSSTRWGRRPGAVFVAAESMLADPTDYLVARLHEALTHDPRVHDQSLEVRVEGQRVVLRGEGATRERRPAASAA